MSSALTDRLIEFLKYELGVPEDSISLALRQQLRCTYQLPIILWQFGLISLQQVDSIFDWLETI